MKTILQEKGVIHHHITNLVHKFIPMPQCGNTNTNARKLHVFTVTSQHATRDPTTQRQGWRFCQVSPWRPDHTRGSRQDIHSTRVPITVGKLMARYHLNVQKMHCTLQHGSGANVDVPLCRTYGLVTVRERQCDDTGCSWTVLGLWLRWGQTSCHGWTWFEARQASSECAKESFRTFRDDWRLRYNLKSVCFPGFECRSSFLFFFLRQTDELEHSHNTINTGTV